MCWGTIINLQEKRAVEIHIVVVLHSTLHSKLFYYTEKGACTN